MDVGSWNAGVLHGTMTSKRHIGLWLRPKSSDPLNDRYKIVLELSLHVWAYFLGVISSRMELCDIIWSHHLHIDIWDLAKYKLAEVTSYHPVRAIELQAMSFGTMLACHAAW